MSKTNKAPTFSNKVANRYDVSIAGLKAGTVEKVDEDYWLGRYSDGSIATAGNRRIDAAWSLINS
jgi:hypothetical protein